ASCGEPPAVGTERDAGGGIGMTSEGQTLPAGGRIQDPHLGGLVLPLDGDGDLPAVGAVARSNHDTRVLQQGAEGPAGGSVPELEGPVGGSDRRDRSAVGAIFQALDDADVSLGDMDFPACGRVPNPDGPLLVR